MTKKGKEKKSDEKGRPGNKNKNKNAGNSEWNYMEDDFFAIQRRKQVSSISSAL